MQLRSWHRSNRLPSGKSRSCDGLGVAIQYELDLQVAKCYHLGEGCVMGQPVKLSDELIDDARAVVPFSQRSIAGQIEF
jgi:ParD-like antitoxin of type II bacterial toxin-antitoxin system